ncbi:MAG: hypothetical protein K2J20_03575, partial [Bacilli bacterium]|nr:hypothetical protein [Bacilli bacterium]
KNIVEIFKNSIYNIRQNTAYDIDNIQSLFKNTTTYNKVISCYYGIVKNILNFIYINGNKSQSELVLFINFEAVPIVESELISAHGNEEKKILSINLPYDSFYNLSFYFPLLYHEVGHYINPKNRIQRNYYVFTIIISFLEKYIFCNISDEKTFYNIITTEIYAKGQNILHNCGKIFEYTWDEFVNKLEQAFYFSDEDTRDIKFESLEYELQKLVEFICEIQENIEKKLTEKHINFSSKKYDTSYWQDVLSGLLNGVREATADFFMINSTNMKCSDYLSLIIFTRYRQSLWKDLTVSTGIRIYAIMQYFKIDISDEQFMKELFADVVLNTIKIISNDKQSNLEDLLSDICIDILRHLQDIEKKYSCFLDLVPNIMNTV